MGGAGFIVAGDRAVLVIDQKSKARTRLAPNESLFIPAGSIQTWASLDDQPAAAYTLELVASGTSSDVPGGKLVYADKKSFAIPEGDYVLGLVRDVLAKNEKGKLNKTSYNTLLMAMSGSLTIQSDAKNAKAVTLTGGHAAVFSGDLTIKSTKDGSSYVAALIGPATGVSSVTPAAKTPTPKPEKTKTPKATATPKKSGGKKSTPTPESGATVTIGFSICPNGVRPETGIPGLPYCGPGNGYYDLSLIDPDGKVMDASEATATYVVWPNLKPGVYQLIVNLIPPGYDAFTLDGYLCCSTPGGYLLTVDKNANVVGTIYVYQPYIPPAPTPTPAPPSGPENGGGGGNQSEAAG
jgi:hypothetical protein